MRVRIDGLLTDVERSGPVAWTASFRAGRVHSNWVNVKVWITERQAEALHSLRLISRNHCYEYIFYDHIMEVVDHTGEHQKTVVKVFEDQMRLG